ncbi:50S ribosomal protein L31 [Flavobacterium rivuli WB 3.3-2 = DSM 21788]|uniref:50S ribosomal protein L31 n=1 Tax=Flavobacterium rivuli WB 3.3-2 = DSM 21788 TaxID=1121895 RepID=A0A0A2MEM1_9FLAO|nr:PDDEXK nuclease domain-containing protein [Flavobacterium rivuli]KGO86735.1 50S ribosomal protein L31 [Flavobacterium rivuli WB 3.3-2 = DSM 21788]
MLQPNLLSDVKTLIAAAKENAIRSVDHYRTLLYWHIGERIFNEEQQGKDRADYGSYLIKYLSKELQPEHGESFSSRNLNWYRQFYKTFPIVNTLRSQLSWSHYRTLLRIENNNKREYYIAETVKNNWSVRQMERQINSQLYERLLMSNDKESVLAVARNEKLPTTPQEIIKDPMILEFLGLRRESAYYEKDLEQAIITHLQDFLLELGNGFSFVARQKRIHLDGDEFYADLVFYNRLLQCFVVFEIKTHKLTHEDLGQLQMYVNYFDRVEKLEHEKPTIGVLLCADKNNAVVKFSLPENNKTIMASQYKLILPTEEQLLNELRKEIENQNNQP